MNLESKIKELNLYDFEIEITESIIEVTKRFKSNPSLPGVIIVKNNRFVGMISQKKYWKHMSRPYSLDLASKRSVEYVWDFLQNESIILWGNTTIVETVAKVLKRSPGLLEEPIIVEIKPKVYRMLDIHQLLVAHAKIHKLATESIEKMCQQLELSKQRLENYSKIDRITKLANRSVFDEYLEKKWKLSFNKTKSLLYLLILEIDYFKEYNDTYGYLEGDKCLGEIAKIINNVVSKTRHLSARYGGCKLTVIIANKSGLQTSSIAENIHEQVRSIQITHPDSPIAKYVTLSCGIASMIPSLANSPKTLIRAAEQALARAKKAGGNGTVIWNESNHKDLAMIANNPLIAT
ncbi:MAG: GGDEF domain-containing protein [Prochloraceae cyanobacterium]|nr:GGDEF domain-containing protein [Prochloraceae cyanobacterium]